MTGRHRPVLAIGAFDGVHVGHQAILAHAQKIAQRYDVSCAAVTFDRHPSSIVRPSADPILLSTLTDRLALLVHYGAELVVTLRFDERLASLSAETFVREVLVGRLRAGAVVIGRDFRFGHHRRGDLEMLQSLGENLGFAVHPVPDVLYKDGRISSTRIRQALSAGDLAEASGLLGRPHYLCGRVVKGRQLGRTLGFPTANLRPDPMLLIPKCGIYAGWFFSSNGAVSRPAAVSIGYRPTVQGRKVTIEAHLLEYSGNLYGQDARLALMHRIRDEQRFSSLDALRAQIGEDVRQCSRLLLVEPPLAG